MSISWAMPVLSRYHGGMLMAITRQVSPSIARCELQYRERESIDLARAIEQHREYERCLRELGAEVISLPAEPDLPDAMFVEDAAIVLDEVAVIARPGAVSRRPEVAGVARALGLFRPLCWLSEPATLDGGDVLRMGRCLYVGLSGRTNRAGVAQLASEVEPFGYRVEAVEVTGCLHLKSACSHLGDGVLLANPGWFHAEALRRFRVIEVAAGEPGAANVLPMGGAVLAAASFPGTASALEKAGYAVRTLDISEIQKAEAGMTCSSLVFQA